MKVTVTHAALSQIQADVVVALLPEGAALPAGTEGPVASLLSQAMAAGDFKGESGESAVFYTQGAWAARKLLAYGLGKAEKLDVVKIRKAAGMAVRAARTSGATSVALAVPAVGDLKPGRVARFVTEGSLRGLFRFRSFKSEQQVKPNVESLIIAGPAGIQEGVEYGRVLGEAVGYTRDLNWLPGNHLTATDLAEKAREVCAAAGIEIAVYDKKGCQELGLGLLLAVNQGSVEEPRFIVMRYQGNGGKGPWLGLVGKGITFDSGGISIKPTDGMWDMKYDMSGAGAVLGAMQAIGQLKPKADVLAIICATDNLPDGNAYKPGDVIVGLSGKTVEVRSTDAEGRLVLSDGLAYAVKQGAAKLITASTLTGAANIALGPQRFGIVSNNDAWETEVQAAAEEAGEKGWRLPHDEEYYDLFKSPIADMSNTGTGRSAGTVVGGLFLMKHVGETPCVHMDIAAQAWTSGEPKDQDPGATGVAVATFVRAAFRWAQGQ